MKKIRLLLAVVLLVSAGTFSGTVSGQEGGSRQSDKQREEELQKAINEQKKAISEQRKQQEEAQQKLMESMKEMEKLRDYDFEYDFNSDGNNAGVRIYRGSRSFSPDLFVVPEAPGVSELPSVFIGSRNFFGDSERTSWEFTKSVKENSFKKEYNFDVEKSVRSVTMAISGDCKAGEIRIKILTPQGKTYSDVVIDAYGNINVRKSFNISETENQDKTGEWKFQINSENATGYFKISFQTF